MPQKVLVHLMFPSQDTHVQTTRKVALDGRYRDDKAKIDVPLHPNMSTNGGREIWIDAERGVQVQYQGLKGWVGLDGRYQHASDVRKDAADLRARGEDPFQKLKWWIFAMVAVSLAALCVALYVVIGNSPVK